MVDQMTKVTSRAAYEVNKKYHPNLQWKILRLLFRKNTWMGAVEIADHREIDKKPDASSPRLRELEDAGLVDCLSNISNNVLGTPVVSYKITSRGREVVREGHRGRWLLKELNKVRSIAQEVRQIALAPHKERENKILRDKMETTADNMVSGLRLF
jgi:DNA-binding PadR family transcriptional regulator